MHKHCLDDASFTMTPGDCTARKPRVKAMAKLARIRDERILLSHQHSRQALCCGQTNNHIVANANEVLNVMLSNKKWCGAATCATQHEGVPHSIPDNRKILIPVLRSRQQHVCRIRHQKYCVPDGSMPVISDTRKTAIPERSRRQNDCIARQQTDCNANKQEAHVNSQVF